MKEVIVAIEEVDMEDEEAVVMAGADEAEGAKVEIKAETEAVEIEEVVGVPVDAAEEEEIAVDDEEAVGTEGETTGIMAIILVAQTFPIDDNSASLPMYLCNSTVNVVGAIVFEVT